MENILRKEFPPADRPYSQNELIDMRDRILGRLKVGNTMVYHQQTGYFYLAKSGGKKEIAVQSGEELDPAGCSVCWKLRKTPNNLREEARNMVEAYQVNFEKKPDKWNLGLINLEATFYKWLYLNFDKRDRRDQGDRRDRRDQGDRRDRRDQGDRGRRGGRNFNDDSGNNQDRETIQPVEC
jgi:hypothetical protein